MENQRDTFCSRCGGSLEVQWVEGEGMDRPVCQACGFILYLNPKVVAGAVECVKLYKGREWIGNLQSRREARIWLWTKQDWLLPYKKPLLIRKL